MSSKYSSLIAQAPFLESQVENMGDSALVVSTRHSLGLMTLAARKAQDKTLALRVREQFHIDLPQGPYRAARGELAFAGLGPGAWLVTHEGGDRAIVDALTPVVSSVASVADQSDGYAVLRLSGHGVRYTLGKLVPLDLHVRAFGVGAVACTAVAHIAGILWRLSDRDDGAPVFEIAIHRSFSEYLWRALFVSL